MGLKNFTKGNYKRLINLLLLPISILGYLVLIDIALNFVIPRKKFTEQNAVDTANHQLLCNKVAELWHRGIRAIKFQGEIILRVAGDDCFHHSSHRDNGKYYIASLAKQVTAAKIKQLANRNLLNLDKNFCLQLGFNCHPDWQNVTVNDILNHRSGLSRQTRTWWNPIVMIKQLFFNLNPAIKEKELLRNSLSNEYGKFHYSNAGYFLLYRLIEKISGHSFQSEISTMTKNKMRALKINQKVVEGSFNEPLLNILQIFNLPISLLGYNFGRSPGSGSMLSTPAEYLDFVENTVIPNLTISEAVQYQFGVKHMRSTQKRPYIWHNGGIWGLSTEFFYYPNLSIGSALFINKKANHPSTKRFIKSYKNLMAGKRYELPYNFGRKISSHARLIIDE